MYKRQACIWDLLHRLDELNDYIKCVDAIHTCLAASDIHSAGFLGLKAYVEKIYADNGFAELKKDISELKMDTSQLKSITVGIKDVYKRQVLRLSGTFQWENAAAAELAARYVLGKHYLSLIHI